MAVKLSEWASASPTCHSLNLPTNLALLHIAGDLDGGGVFTVGPNFGFEGLACSGTCDVATSIEAIEGDNSSDDGTGRTMAIVVGSVVSGVGLAALVGGMDCSLQKYPLCRAWCLLVFSAMQIPASKKAARGCLAR